MTKMNARTQEVIRQIASYLNIDYGYIIRCEEWAAVWFVVIEGKGGRFISKSVVKYSECQIKELTDRQTGNKSWGIVSPKGGCFKVYKTLKAAQQAMMTTAHSYIDYYAASASGSIINSYAIGNYNAVNLISR